MKMGHVPIRQCIACRKRRPQRELIRLKACGVTVTVTSHRESTTGRGCYVCPDPECIHSALKKGRMQRAFNRNALVLPSEEQLLGWARAKEVKLNDYVDR